MKNLKGLSNKFSKHGCYACRICGKLTREVTGDDSAVQLCLRCLNHEEALNAHNDNGHRLTPVTGCIICVEVYDGQVSP